MRGLEDQACLLWFHRRTSPDMYPFCRGGSQKEAAEEGRRGVLCLCARKGSQGKHPKFQCTDATLPHSQSMSRGCTVLHTQTAVAEP